MQAKNEVNYNPWHGCIKKSEGCRNCYIYAMDEIFQRESAKIYKTKSFYLPLAKNRNNEYKIPGNSFIYLCFSSDFLISEADCFRGEVFNMIKIRKDCDFMFFTKRIERFCDILPKDWGDGYENVIVGCSVENQKMADERLPIFLNAPIKRRYIICAPLLESINLKKYLNEKISLVSVGGESGKNARICRYKWILDIAKDCRENGVKFHFHQTGKIFEKDGKIYKIPKIFQREQAKKALIDDL